MTITNTKPADFVASSIIVRQADTGYLVSNEYEIKLVPTNPLQRLSWIEVEIPARLGIVYPDDDEKHAFDFD